MATSRKDFQGRVLRKGEIQRKSDKRYVYTFTDPFGKRKSIYATTLKALRAKEDELKKDQLDGLDVYVAGQATLNFVFDRYLSLKQNLRNNTRHNYEYMYNHFVRKTLGKRKIAEIKYSDVKYFYQALMNEYGLGISTVDTIHTLLHPTFELAVMDDIIRKNPSKGVMCEMKKADGKNKGIRHALTLGQQRAFMNYTKQHQVYSHWAPLFVVFLGTGCRVGEIVGLRWEDIDFENRIISINHSMVYYPKPGSITKKSELQLSKPKTEAGIRIIPMLDEVYEVLRTEYEFQQEAGFNSTTIDGMTGFIFCNKDGNVHNPQTINRTIKRIVSSYNAEEVIKAKRQHRDPLIIPNFSCHHLRHTFCTRLCEMETNIKVVQSVMGHANIETTMDIYAEATKDKKVESFKDLSTQYSIF